MTHIRLDLVRMLPLGTIRSFLTDIAMHISDYRPGTLEYLQTNQEIDLALTGVLWETQEISQDEFEPGWYGRVEVELSGIASFYLRQAAWRAMTVEERGEYLRRRDEAAAEVTKKT